MQAGFSWTQLLQSSGVPLAVYKLLQHLLIEFNLTPFHFTFLPMTPYLEAHSLADSVATQSADVATSPFSLALKV